MKSEIVKSEKTTIDVAEHVAFEGDMKTNLVSTIEMCEIVSSLFKPAFTDFYGCNIRANTGNNNYVGTLPGAISTVPVGSIYVDLYFKDLGRSSTGALKTLSLFGQNVAKKDDEKKGNNLAKRFEQVNASNNAAADGHVYDVSKETYEALEEFMFVRNPRWREHTKEMSVSMGMIGSKEEVVVCISGLSLDKILTKIYGSKTKEGEFEYSAVPSTIIPGQNNEFIMQVTQLNLAVVRKLHRELGINNPANPQFHVYH